MRITFLAFSAAIIALAYGLIANAQTNASGVFTANLSLGSSGVQVVALQRLLNRDVDTRIASAGPGSPGNETAYFGLLTQTAVARFQEKYAEEILVPAALARGNGYVGQYTRAKLNALSVPVSAATKPADASPGSTPSTKAPATTSVPVIATAPTAADYAVRDNEKIDIYAGDAMLENVRNRIYAAVNAAVASQSVADIALPAITLSDMPSVVIGMVSPQSGTSGTRVSIQGSGISPQSVVYFGETYVLRAISRDASDAFSFIVPPLPPARYDIAVRTGSAVSNTTMFVLRDLRNPPARVQNVSPFAVAYSGTLTITGSGFTKQDNVVVTTYQKFTNVPSPDGKTIVIRLTPDVLRESAKIGDGTRSIPMSLYVVNDYGFSNATESFTISI